MAYTYPPINAVNFVEDSPGGYRYPFNGLHFEFPDSGYTPQTGNTLNVTFGEEPAANPDFVIRAHNNVNFSYQSFKFTATLNVAVSVSASLYTEKHLHATLVNVVKVKPHIGTRWEETMYIENFMTMII